MRVWRQCVLAGMVLVTGPTWAINKCIGSDGKAVFQDRPCEGRGGQIEVRPAAGNAPASPAAASDKPKMTEADRLNALTDQSQRDRRRWELREHLLPTARSEQAQHKAQCEQTQKTLAAQQHQYLQNLYGKTHAAQIASEMAAAAALCDTKSREIKNRIDTLAGECTALDCMRR